MEIYLLPTKIVYGLNIVMEYRIVRRPKDMRTKFCKDNTDRIIQCSDLLITLNKLKINIQNGDIIRFSSAEQSQKFKHLMKLNK